MRTKNIGDNKAAEIFLGLGLGFGFLTSLRFFGPVGAPEIMVALGLSALILRNPIRILKSASRRERIVKIYLLASTLIVLPIVTLIIELLSVDVYRSAPEYIMSFAAGVLLMIYLADAIRHHDINMLSLTKWFALAFVVANLAAIFYFGYGDEKSRYTGGAKNPNQLTFYAATLSLLLVVYARWLAFIVVPVVIFFLLKARSDAYQLALFVIVVMYAYFKITFYGKTSFLVKTAISICFGLIIFFGVVFEYGDRLADLWRSADEGGSRVSLMENAFLASLQSPLFGFGAGSFSGVFNPFSGSEAHNTFLDLSMQFGFIYPLVIYGIMIAALLFLLKNRQFLIAAFVMGFIESGIFHFSARHFTFWAEMAVFWGYAFSGAAARRRLQKAPVTGFAR